ncbi:hypothetical protein OF83DRAFT_1087680, partial [Amylostereum chailletii]
MYYPDSIAANQVIVFWTANTVHYSLLVLGFNDTTNNFLANKVVAAVSILGEFPSSMMLPPERVRSQCGRRPHSVVIKYISVIDNSKRAIDERHAARSWAEVTATFRSSMSARTPCSRCPLSSFTPIQYKKPHEGADFKPLYSVPSLLSYMCKPPLVEP